MDGWITIGTKLDTSDFDKGVKELENKTENAGNKLSDGIEKATTKASDVKFENAEKSVDELEKGMDNVTDTLTNAVGQLGIMSGETAEFVAEIGKMAVEMGVAVSTVAPIIAIIVGVAAAIKLVITAIDKLKEAVKKAIESFKKLIVAMLTPTIEAIKRLLRSLIDLIRNGVAKAFDILKQKAKEGVDNLAQVSSELNGALSSLQNSINQVGNAIASAFAPVIEAVTPMLNSLLDTIVSVAHGIAQITASLFGNATTFRVAKKTSDDYAKSLGGAGKAAKNALAAFDEINVLPSQSSGGAAAGAGAAVADMFEEVAISKEVLDLTNKLKELWNTDDIEGLRTFGHDMGVRVKQQIDELPAYEWAKGIGEKINKAFALANGFLETNPGKNLGTKIAEIILGFFDGVTPEQVGMLIANVINNGFGLVWGFVERMNKKNDKGQNGWQRVGEWLEDTLTTAIDNLDVDTMAEAIGGFVEGIADLAITMFGNWILNGGPIKLAKKIQELLNKINWEEILPKVLKAILLGWIAIKGTRALIGAAILKTITDWILKTVEPKIKEKANGIIDTVLGIFGIRSEDPQKSVALMWENVKKWWKEHVAPVFTQEYWEDLLKLVKKAFQETFKAIVNIVIEKINGMLDVIEKALNKIREKINSLEITNPFTGEEIWSPSIPEIKFGRIPKLARGGIISTPTRALIGESGREAVMPLENNTEWMDMLAERLNARGGDITIKFTGSTAQLVRLLKPELEKEDKRTGKRLIVGGAY